MDLVKLLAIAVLIAAVGAMAFALWLNGRDDRAADALWRALSGARGAGQAVYDSAMVSDLPTIARRYFDKAIAPGTPLVRVVELEMEGRFFLQARSFPMRSAQILAPLDGFVWKAWMGEGLTRLGGSDAYRAGITSWTRFWLMRVVPLARAGGTGDHARASAARMMMETIWTPAALLPRYGALWREISPDVAEVSFPALPEVEPIHLTLDLEGRVVEVVTQRWSDANADRQYRLQPFGGRMLAHGRHQGFTIPTEVEVGNLFGTADYAPLLHATVVCVRY